MEDWRKSDWQMESGKTTWREIRRAKDVMEWKYNHCMTVSIHTAFKAESTEIGRLMNHQRYCRNNLRFLVHFIKYEARHSLGKYAKCVDIY